MYVESIPAVLSLFRDVKKVSASWRKRGGGGEDFGEVTVELILRETIKRDNSKVKVEFKRWDLFLP